MSAGTLIVAAIILLLAVSAAAVLLRDRARGKNSCGCNCKGCSGCSGTNVTIGENGDSRY